MSLARYFSHLHPRLLAATMLLFAFGIAMLYSAGGGWQPWAGPQAIRLFLFLGLMVALTVIPLRWWWNLAPLVYLGGLGLLGLVLVMGTTGGGAQRWLQIGPLALQPSEPMKIALIITLARWFHMISRDRLNRLPAMVITGALLAVPVGMILLQPNLGTATITMAIGLGMWFLAGLSWRIIVPAVLIALLALPVAWNFVLHDYQKQRVETFLNPSADPLGSGYNSIQSAIAIGSGGVLGKGYMRGPQGQLDFLPEKHTDFIFAMVAEELGFLGALLLLGLLAWVILLSFSIAATSSSRFGALIAGGIGCLILLHVMINIGMVVGLLPVVGVPLPFMSYGGSIQLTALAAMGLLQRVWIERDIPLEK